MPTNNGTGNIQSFQAVGTVGTQVNVIVKASRNGCDALDENFQIQVNPVPVAAVSFSPSFVCEGSTLILTAEPQGLASSDYTWTLPDNSQLTGNYANVLNTTQVHSGTYKVDLIAGGCPGTATGNFTITPPVDPILGQIGAFCENVTALTPLTSDVLGSWTGTGVVNGNSFQPSTGLTGTNPLTFTPQTGVCANSGSISVTVNPMPIIAPITGGTGCGPLEVIFSPFNTADVTTIAFGDGTNSNVTGATISNIYNTSGYYDVTVSQTTNGCTTTETFDDIVYVEPNPVASFVAKNNILYVIDPKVELENNSTGAVSYDWDFGDGNNSTITNPKHQYEEKAAVYTITLVATSDAGCIDEVSHTIQIKDQLLFFSPNTFTPDGDQHNNTFQPVFTSGFDPQNFSMVIYNRWGNIIFETHNAEIGWDGTFQGKLAQEGIYSWTMEMKDPGSDEKYSFQGHIFLIR